MSNVDPRAVASFLFAEQTDSVAPSDATGNLADLSDDATTTVPSVLAGTISGHARVFVSGSATALLVADTGDDLELTRGMAVVALLELDVASQAAYGADGTVIQRGEGVAGDSLSWALRLSIINASTRTVNMYLEWETVAGVLVTDSGANFVWPAGEVLLLGASREVVAGGLVCSYYVNSESASNTAKALDVDSTSGADVWVGGNYNGSIYTQYLDATVEAIEVYNEAISAEEFGALFLRMSEDLPQAISAIKKMVPPGVYSTDEDSSIQRELSVQGGNFGTVRAFIRRMRDYIWPSTSWGSVLGSWEAMAKYSPKPFESIATRRSRVTSFLGSVRGFSIVDVPAVLEETLDLDSADIAILEYDNDFNADFSADAGDSLSNDGNNTRSYASSKLRYTPSTNDLLFTGGPEGGEAGWIVWPVAGELDAWISGEVSIDGTSNAELTGCLTVGSRTSNEWLLLGTSDDGTVGYATYMGGALSAWTNLTSGGEKFLRIKCLGDGAFELRIGATAAAADAATPTAISGGPTLIGWAGFVATIYSASTVTGFVELEDFLIHAPNGSQRFNWYAYRDPALAGTPDIEGANLVVQRIKPANTHAAAVTQKSVTYDDTDSGYDREPMGL